MANPQYIFHHFHYNLTTECFRINILFFQVHSYYTQAITWTIIVTLRQEKKIGKEHKIICETGKISVSCTMLKNTYNNEANQHVCVFFVPSLCKYTPSKNKISLSLLSTSQQKLQELITTMDVHFSKKNIGTWISISY